METGCVVMMVRRHQGMKILVVLLLGSVVERRRCLFSRVSQLVGGRTIVSGGGCGGCRGCGCCGSGMMLLMLVVLSG